MIDKESIKLLKGFGYSKKVLDNPTPDIEEEEWEPDMDDFGTCDVADTY